MSRLTELIRQAKRRDPQLGADLEAEINVLSGRRAFGLNFERHRPEAVELPNRPVRKGDKVRILPARGSAEAGDQRLWRVNRLEKRDDTSYVGHLCLVGASELEQRAVPLADLVVVAEFRDHVFPGLASTGTVTRGANKPYHTVINGENFHVLEALTYTHRGKIDVIYIDPPYNTGAHDWKYNNNYVDGEDLYRHSKWLAFMERRLKLAQQLLNPDDSVLIVTIDEKEYLRLGLLLEQTFVEANIQMVSTVINPAGAGRSTEFARTDEYIFFVRLGRASVTPEQRSEERRAATWDTLRRSDIASRRGTAKGGTGQFYPFYVNTTTHRIEAIGNPLPHGTPRDQAPKREGCVSVFPVRPDGTEMNWGITAGPARERLEKGYVRVGKAKPKEPQQYVISYLTGGIIADIDAGKVEVSGRASDGSVIAHYVIGREVMPTTHWNRPSHDAQRGGTAVIKALMPDRRFPFPKSLYAVEDSLLYFVKNKPNAIILDFFAGSGTTAHAVMRLNRQDGGRRQCISVTNNEVAENEQKSLKNQGLRPGDPDWEQWGICEYITKPRIKAAITGVATNGASVAGEYKFNAEFPMADGFEENAAFFTLTYETPISVAHNHAFERIAPLLWMRAGASGRQIDKIPEKGWDSTESYGILFDLDQITPFSEAVRKVESLQVAYVVTDDERRYQSVVRRLPSQVETVRLYESYLSNFRITYGE